jgi:phosphoribosyl 1,2-cyclic phosphodiesterase
MDRVFTMHGVRGSVPVGGAAYVRHGGATTSFSLALDESTALVVDAGTGIRDLTPAWAKRAATIHLFLTHYHHDHLNGLPFFAPMLREGSRLVVYGHPCEDGTPVEEAVRGFMRPPWFPVSFADVAAAVEFVDLDHREVTVAGVRVTAARLTHPQGCTGYRLQSATRSLVVATDHERGLGPGDDALRGLAAGTDVLLHDGQYLPEEYPDRIGWGHSTWEGAVAAAHETGAAHLVLVSHDPNRSDDAIDEISAAARAAFPNTVAGRAGMTIPL